MANSINWGNFSQPLNAPSTQKSQPKQKKGGLQGFLESIAQPFVKTGQMIGAAPIAISREIHNKPIEDIQKYVYGTTDPGSIAKQTVGNLAQVGAAAAPVSKGAGILQKVVSGAKAGAATGAGNALANDRDVVKGTLEGAAFGGALGGVLPGNKTLTNSEKISSEKTGGFLNNLTTQGQQMQGRGIGISGGAKIGAKELDPQDTEKNASSIKKRRDKKY